MSSPTRLLLVEQLDSVGSSLADLLPRAQVLRRAGYEVRMVAIATEGDDDLQHGTTERPRPGVDRLDEHGATERVRRAAEAHHADAIVWASATPGGGDRARALAAHWASWWWPTGWSAAGTSGKLPAISGDADPGDACVIEGERPRLGRLSLWDGPYALVATPLSAGDAASLFEAFDHASDGRDEVDLVLLDHPDPEVEAVARDAGILQRVHFVGRAPLEAEGAWLQHARAAFVGLSRPLSAGFVLRALAAGCPVLPVGSAADPVANWLRGHGAWWAKSAAARPGSEAIAAALERKPSVETAVARGRTLAAVRNVDVLGTSFASVLLGHPGRRERAA